MSLPTFGIVNICARSVAVVTHLQKTTSGRLQNKLYDIHCVGEVGRYKKDTSGGRYLRTVFKNRNSNTKKFEFKRKKARSADKIGSKNLLATL